MRTRVERLRIYLLGSVIFLLLVIGAFIGLARYLRRHSMVLLPVRLAMNILREGADWTYCPSNESSKKFCIHAAKSVEYNNGKVILHDASITLYGTKGDRNDRIYGDDFEYDKNAQIVRATGVVHIDLQAAGTAGSSGQPAAGAKVMHVTTRGLVYLQKMGLASTSEPVEFEADGLTGHAVGADYSSDSELISLHSAVTLSGVVDGHAVAMTAATAAFDDHSQQALLTHATYESEGRRAAADQATLYRRPDGTLSRIDAKGDVTMEAKGSTVTAGHADVALTAASQAQTAVLTGGVKFLKEEPLRQVSGAADAATIHFDAEKQPQPEQATFTGGVHAMERTRATAASGEPWSTRELKAGRVEVALTRMDAGPAQVRDVVATGGPDVMVVNRGSLASSAGAGTTELSADTLSAHLGDAGDAKAPQVETIAGRGSTLLRQLTPDGKEQTVGADSLDAKLRPKSAMGDAKPGGTAQDKLSQSLLSSVQVGHVQMMQRVPAKPGDAGGKANGGYDVEHALADRAVYDGDADRMTLSEGVQLSDASSVVWADQVVLDHKTSDAHASGGVRVSYMEDAAAGKTRGSDEPAHVMADRADLEHATGVSTFYGKPVRLWQGGNQILAPVIELSKAQKRLVARGDAGGGGMQVRTVLAGSGNAKAGAASGSGSGPGACVASATAKAGAGGAGSAQTAGAVQVTSGGLAYSASAGEADFSDGFRADTADGTIRAAEGVLYLKQDPAQQNGATSRGTPVASLSGELDHVVATGRVELDKPGLKATGERLVYTVSDRTAVLTGDAKTPPKAVGLQGSTTGVALRLRSFCDGSDSVEVVGGPGQRAHTDARAGDAVKKQKGKQ